MITPKFHHYDIVESTNDIAIQMARSGEPEGTVITANQQTKGRGRRGRQWRDDHGNSVLMSMILTPNIPHSHFPQLSFVVSLSVAKYLVTHHSLPAQLKWPNDVYINAKKISGILTEVTTHPAGLAAICGIGVNVSQTTFPPDIAHSATSIAIETGTTISTGQVTPTLTGVILQNYHTYLALGFKEILSQWQKYMWGVGCQADVLTDNNVITGTITGVDPTGALVLLNADGSEHIICAADAVNLRVSS